MYIDIQKAKVIIRYWLLAKEYYRASKAFELAKSKCVGLRKDQKTPEIYHPLALIFYLKTLSKYLIYPEETFVIGFIHDLGEDYGFTITDVEEKFGQICSRSFEKITKKSEIMVKNTQAYYKGLSEDPIASIVKAADRIHNHQSMYGVFSEEKIAEYLKETQDFVLPMIKIARRNFPEQEAAYENAKHILLSQIELIELLCNQGK